MSSSDPKKKKKEYEPAYLGGLASIGASILTHPLDTVKVQLQTQKQVQFGFFGMTTNIVRTSGFFSLYNGLSAAMLRQGTYSTARFAFYDLAKNVLLERANENRAAGEKQVTQLPFYQMIIIAGAGGAIGSVFGSPADLINVRMQNDSKLAPELRRNYKNCFEALYRITRDEGFMRLYTGYQMGALRCVLVTIGQLAFYDEIKLRLIQSTYFRDNFFTHFTASMGAGLIATVITMPTDVIKTLLMNAKPGEIKGILHCTRDVLKADPFGLFKGFWPRYIRLGPFTILTFVFYEKLKQLYRFIYSF